MPRKKEPKPLRYPRKLRVTLEKIAAAAEEHDTGLPDAEDDNPAAFGRSFWSTFYQPNSVHFIYAQADHVFMRTESIAYIFPLAVADRHFIPPPWKTNPPLSDADD
jgi:hypothetical protein